jgi:dTMP kinase
MFITFEGGEGSGKTTQISLIKNALLQKNHSVITTREPGGTPEAEKIRDLLVQRDGGNWTPTAEAMLFFTARHMHVETKIKPALANNQIVICDRFTDSTMAYQGYGHGFDFNILKAIKHVAIGDLEPDLTFILDIDVKEGLARAGKRMEGDDSTDTEDRFERMKIDFHERLRQGYLTIAKQNPHRCHVIDATLSIDTLHQKIMDIILQSL